MKKIYFKSIVQSWLEHHGLKDRVLQLRYNDKTGHYRAFFAQYIDGANFLHSQLCCPGRFSVDYISTDSGEEVVLKTDNYKARPQ